MYKGAKQFNANLSSGSEVQLFDGEGPSQDEVNRNVMAPLNAYYNSKPTDPEYNENLDLQLMNNIRKWSRVHFTDTRALPESMSVSLKSIGHEHKDFDVHVKIVSIEKLNESFFVATLRDHSGIPF